MHHLMRVLYYLPVATLVTLVASSSSSAQDVATVAPDVYKVILENEKVRVLKGHFDPGDSVAVHSHPDHFVYALSGGTLRLNHAGKESSVVNIEPGQVMWIPAEAHSARNIGKTALEFVVTELKGLAKPMDGHQH
jgi:quercetin dioxygenase-like cupin family protein